MITAIREICSTINTHRRKCSQLSGVRPIPTAADSVQLCVGGHLPSNTTLVTCCVDPVTYLHIEPYIHVLLNSISSYMVSKFLSLSSSGQILTISQWASFKLPITLLTSTSTIKRTVCIIHFTTTKSTSSQDRYILVFSKHTIIKPHTDITILGNVTAHHYTSPFFL